MKFIDKNGKIFGKISVIDLVVILVALLLIASLCYSKFSTSGSTAAVNKQVEYSTMIKVYSILDNQREPFSVGDNIYSNEGSLIGKITKIDKQNTVNKMKLYDGTYIDFAHPEYYDYYVTIEGSGSLTDKGVFAGSSLALIPSNNILISSRYYDGNAVVLSVEKNV